VSLLIEFLIRFLLNYPY